MPRLGKTVLVLAVAGITIPATAGVVTRRHAERAWGGLEERFERIEAAHGGRATRSILREDGRKPTAADEAFEHYARACRQALRSHLHCGNVPRASLEELEAEGDAEREARIVFQERTAPVLREIRLGALSPTARLDLDWDSGNREWPWGVVPVGYEQGRCAVSLAGTALPRLMYQVFLGELRDGRPDEALGILLDWLQMNRDLAGTPLLHEGRRGAERLVPHQLVSFGEEGGWARLPEECLNRWIDALAAVDGEVDTIGTALPVDVVLEARCLESFLLRSPVWWEHGLKLLLSPLVARASRQASDTYHLLLDLAQEYGAAFESDPLRAPEHVLARYRQGLQDGSVLASRAHVQVEVVSEGIDEFEHHAAGRLQGLARLRLLRAALCTLAGRDDGPTTDRLGLAIEEERSEGTRRYYIDDPRYEGVEIRIPAREGGAGGG